MSLLTPDFGLVFWMLVTFLIVFFILAKFAWPVITDMIAERNQYIENSIQSAKEANEKLQNIKAETEKILADAKRQQLQIVNEASKVKEQIISEAKNQADAEAAKLIENAKTTIQSEKDNALKEIKVQVIELSLMLSEKVLQNQLSDKASQEAFINKKLDEINTLKK